MKQFLVFIATWCVLGMASVCVGAPAPLERRSPKITYLKLQPYANQKLKDTFHAAGTRFHNLAELPTGKQTFGGVKFTVGEGLIQLGSARVKGPEAVEGIEVGRFVGKLHFLHSCGCGGADPDGTVIGKYVAHYDDKTTAEVEIVYGEDVVDWWIQPGQKDARRSKVGWEGENELTRARGAKLHLSLTTWENPHPRKEVTRLDYVSSVKCHAAPFCVAITAEGR